MKELAASLGKGALAKGSAPASTPASTPASPVSAVDERSGATGVGTATGTGAAKEGRVGRLWGGEATAAASFRLGSGVPAVGKLVPV